MADTKELDSQLASSLRQAKSKPMYFAFVAKGLEGSLLVDKKKIPPKDVNEARKELGGGLIFRGRVQGEDGQMVFELPVEPPEMLAKQIKKSIKASAGLTMEVVTRFSSELAEEEGVEHQDEAESGSDSIPTAPPLPPSGQQREAPTPPPPPPVPPQKNAEATRFTTRMKALTPVVQKAEGTNHPQVKDIKQAMKEALGFAAKNDYVLAHQTLDLVEPMLKDVLSSVTGKPSATPPPPPPPPPTPEPDGTDLVKRLNSLTPQIKAGLAGPNKSQIQALVGAVNGLLKSKDFVQADKVLGELDELLARTGTSAPPEPGQKKTDGSFVALQKARLEWDKACKTVASELQALRSAIIQQCEDANLDLEEEDEFDIGELEGKVESIFTILDDMKAELMDPLDDGLNASDSEERAAYHQDAKAATAKFAGKISSNPFVAQIDKSGFLATNIQGTITEALKKLSAVL